MRADILAAVALTMCCLGCSAPKDPPMQSGRPVVLTPDHVLVDSVEDWAEDWAEHTGISISIGTNGIPVLALDQVWSPDQKAFVCGTTHWFDTDDGRFWYAQHIEIDVSPDETCPEHKYAVGHELGHALGATEHCDSGLMGASLGPESRPGLDACAVNAVCDQVACPRLASDTESGSHEGPTP